MKVEVGPVQNGRIWDEELNRWWPLHDAPLRVLLAWVPETSVTAKRTLLGTLLSKDFLPPIEREFATRRRA